tara:strand:+ start:4422 stop:6962 length:2541 start_codon:yes stop_codon:yes gene_type:complete
MNKKHNNLNEEINRIKSLFTEERLYGNLVVESPILLTEGKSKSLKNIMDDVAKAVLKNVNEYQFKPPKGMEGNPRLIIKKNKNGDIIWYRGSKEISPTINNMVSTPTLREIQDNINKVINRSDLESFLKGDGYYDVYNKILKDLQSQSLIDGESAKSLLSTFKKNQIGLKMNNDLLGSNTEDFFKGVYSMKDLKTVHPDFGALVGDIPGLENRIKTILRETKKNFYDDDVVEVTRYFKRMGDEGGWLGSDISTELIGDKGVVKFIVDKSDPLLTSKTFSESKRISYKTNVSNPNEMIVTLDMRGFDNSDIKLLKDNLPDTTGKYVDDIGKAGNISGVEKYLDYESLSDISDQTKKIADNILNSKYRSKNDIISYTGYGKKTLNKINGGLSKIFRNEWWDVIDTYKTAFKINFRENFNVGKWKKSGSGIGDSIDENLKLTDIQTNYVNDFYEVSIPSRKGKGAWIESTDLKTLEDGKLVDTDLFKQGYKEGMIHPNAKLKIDWKKEMYHSIGWGNNGKWRKALFSKHKDYQSWKKTTGRLIKWAGLSLPIHKGGALITQIVSYISDRIVRWAFMDTINDALKDGLMIDSVKVAYQISCLEMVTTNIKDSDLSDKSKNLLVGKVEAEIQGNKGTEKKSTTGQLNEVLKDVGVVNLDGAIKGKEPRYTPIDVTNIDEDLWTWIDVITKDERSIVESLVKYAIKNNKGTGDSWKVIEDNNKTMCLEVKVDNDGNFCTGEDCKKIYFTLECGSTFAEFYNNFKSGEWKKNLYDVGWSSALSVVMGNSTIQEEIMKKSTDIYINTLETLDVNDDGDINAKDFNRAVDNVQNAASDLNVMPNTTGEKGPQGGG